ncbi:MAG TPA: hypothetical protein VLJ21_01105 [Candidatus Binatia bacterium]|nr:hypothetical protein [Candidatus Binatia bacterium]
MKCAICSATVGETFLKKPIGAYVKDAKGKRHLVCFSCQKKFLTKEQLIAQLK